MAASRRRMVILWLGLGTMILVAACRGSPLQRHRRILNEPGDILNKGNRTLPYDKRQQIIYLLNKDKESSKRDKEPGKTVAMEKYAKELVPDGRVVIPNANKLLVSEDFHSGRYKEMAVNKADGPPSDINSDKNFGQTDRQVSSPQKQQQQQQQQNHQQQQQKQVNSAVKKYGPVQMFNESRAEKLVNRNNSDPQVNFKRTETYDVESHNQNHLPLTRNSDINIINEESSSLRKKDSFVKPVGRFFDGELLPPSKPIEPNVFEIGQDEVGDSHRSHFRGELGRHSGMHRELFFPEDRPIRRWRHRHSHYHHRPAPVLMDHQPSTYYMPMYAGRSNVQMAQFAPIQDIHSAPLSDPGQGPTEEYSRQPVMMQSLVPMVPSASAQPGVPLVPSQPMLQSPFVQQPEDRSSLYTLPMATAPQQPPQRFIYPVFAIPAVQGPQPQLVQQPALEQGTRLDHLATHWTDEPGHQRSEVSEEGEPKPREYDDEKSYDDDGRDSRYDEERYHGYNGDESMNERRYQDDRDRIREEEEREAERERLYREREYYENSEPRYEQDTRYVDNVDENASVRSSSPLPVPTAPEETNEDGDDDEENESEENERALQDSRDDPPSTEERPPEVERDEASPFLNYHQREMQSREQPSVIRIPSFPTSHRTYSPFAYPDRLSADTYSREQVLGPSVPLRERILPRFINTAPMMAPIESPNGEISEMSASEARFRERMRMELQAKDTIPKGFHSDLDSDGFKNVVIRLNGEPLENASELRSKIIDGRIVQGRGKIIKSKGPMRIRVTHKGKGINRIKFIDIISPQKYSVTESRSKIGRAPIMNGSSKHNLKKSQIHKTNGHAFSTSHHLRVKDVTATSNLTKNTKTYGN